MRWFPLVALCLPLACAAQETGFKPELVKADLLPKVVRPGGHLSLATTFRNAGTTPAKENYRIFVHIEDVDQGCEAIRIHWDHDPAEPTTFWLPGQTLIDGPLSIAVPQDLAPGTYKLHLGVFGPKGRVLDVDAGRLEVSLTAPIDELPGPAPLDDATAAKRQAAAEALDGPKSIETATFRFAIEPASGAYTLTDKRASVTWTSNPMQRRFGRLALRHGDQVMGAVITGLKLVEQKPNRLVLTQDIKDPDGTATGLALRLTFAVEQAAPGGLKVSYETTGNSPWQVERAYLLDDALVETETGRGLTVVPFRLGRPVPASIGLPTVFSHPTYSGSTMQMLTLEDRGAALLVTWDEVDVTYRVKRLWLDEAMVPGHRAVVHTLELTNGAHSFTLHPLGRGNYVTAAQAYRQVAKRHGWYVTRGEQRRTRPQVDALAGAADFKPFVLSRSLPSSRYNTSDKEQVHLGYKFAQTAELAEHWHNDLQLDKAMVVLAGWINRGYDNQHPDILPAAPECGGNEALAAAGQRIRDCGYLFGLHDNYQDMYEDAPSFSDAMLRRGPDGKSLKGGNWAGGQAWQVRPQDQVALAQRNLPEVKRLFDPTIYFIDTVFAWGLVDSQYEQDLWGRSVDLKYKSELCRYAREQMGTFGSEEGREWAVPVADYLEGLLGWKYDNEPGEVLPTFLLTYHDCVNTYTHQGTRLGASDTKRVLDTLIYAEMPLYSFGGPKYWDSENDSTALLTVSAEVKPTGPRSFEITYLWRASAKPTEDYTAFVHFTDSRKDHEGIVFQHDHAMGQTSTWEVGQVYRDGPHAVAIPEGEVGDFTIAVGLLNKQRERVAMPMKPAGNLRYSAGRILADGKAVQYAPPASAGPSQPFARKDGWARDFGRTDRFIKNTYEVFSWANRLTFGVAFDEHQVDGQVERSGFANGLKIVCNYGEAPTTVEAGPVLGQVVLPQYGFVVWHPEFVAVHATQADGRTYPEPVLFTARSLDGKPLAQSGKARVYHGFGGPELKLAGKAVKVEREAVVALR